METSCAVVDSTQVFEPASLNYPFTPEKLKSRNSQYPKWYLRSSGHWFLWHSGERSESRNVHRRGKQMLKRWSFSVFDLISPPPKTVSTVTVNFGAFDRRCRFDNYHCNHLWTDRPESGRHHHQHFDHGHYHRNHHGHHHNDWDSNSHLNCWWRWSHLYNSCRPWDQPTGCPWNLYLWNYYQCESAMS